MERVMPGWYVVWFVVALVGFAASWNGDLFLISSINAFGILIPVWFVAANLWWVMAHVAHWVWFAGRSRAVLGGCISGTVLTAIVAAPTLTTMIQRTAFMLEAQVAKGMMVADPAHALEIPFAGERVNRRDCDEVCDRSLRGGDVDWVRIRYLASPYRAELQSDLQTRAGQRLRGAVPEFRHHLAPPARSSG